MKLDGMMITIVRYTIPTVNLIHAMFLLIFFDSITHTVRKKASDKHGQILIVIALKE